MSDCVSRSVLFGWYHPNPCVKYGRSDTEPKQLGHDILLFKGFEADVVDIVHDLASKVAVDIRPSALGFMLGLERIFAGDQTNETNSATGETNRVYNKNAPAHQIFAETAFGLFTLRHKPAVFWNSWHALFRPKITDWTRQRLLGIYDMSVVIEMLKQLIDDENRFNIGINTFYEHCWKEGTIFKTEKGRIGLMYSTPRKGDSIVLLHGFSNPVVLRAHTQDTWRIVDYCYVTELSDITTMNYFLKNGEFGPESGFHIV